MVALWQPKEGPKENGGGRAGRWSRGQVSSDFRVPQFYAEDSAGNCHPGSPSLEARTFQKIEGLSEAALGHTHQVMPLPEFRK